MVRAAEAAGLAGFAFTEHIFHLDEPRVASRYLGTRWDGELEGPPIGVDRYLAEIAAAAQAVPAVSVGVGLELEHWPDDPRVREVQDAFVAGARRRLGHDPRLGALPERRSLDLRLVDADLDRRCLGRLLRSASPMPCEHGGYDVVTHPLRLAVSRPEVPRDMARRLDRLADLAAAADVALEVNGSDVRVYPELVQLLCESIARAGAPRQPRLRRTSPAQRGRGARRHRRACARRACAARSRSSAASGATTPFEHDAALGARAAHVRDERVRRLVPADGDRAARLRAGHGHARAHARGRRRARAGRARELRASARLRPAHRRDRSVRPRDPVLAAGLRDDARRRCPAGSHARTGTDRDRARGQHRHPRARRACDSGSPSRSAWSARP